MANLCLLHILVLFLFMNVLFFMMFFVFLYSLSSWFLLASSLNHSLVVFYFHLICVSFRARSTRSWLEWVDIEEDFTSCSKLALLFLLTYNLFLFHIIQFLFLLMLLLSPVCSVFSKCSMFEFWHNKLGHPSVSRMLFVNKFVFKLVVSNTPCTICPLAKQKKITFS